MIFSRFLQKNEEKLINWRPLKVVVWGRKMVAHELNSGHGHHGSGSQGGSNVVVKVMLAKVISTRRRVQLITSAQGAHHQCDMWPLSSQVQWPRRGSSHEVEVRFGRGGYIHIRLSWLKVAIDSLIPWLRVLHDCVTEQCVGTGQRKQHYWS